MTARTGRLLPVLGVGFGLAVTIGNTIGAGIFRAPGEIAGHLPIPWLYMAAWVTGGIYALLGAVQLAELGTMVPRSGGQYVFSRRALGEYPGFLVGWSDWISTCGSTAAVALVVGEFAGALLPVLNGRTVDIAATVVIVFAALQWRGIREGSLVQNATSVIKTLAFAVLVGGALILGGDGLATDAPLQPSEIPLAMAFVLALPAVIYTYDGWSGIVYFSEEVTDTRAIPQSLIGGVLTIVTIYVLVNLSLLYVLPLSRVAGEPFAIGTAAGVLLGGLGEPVFRTLTILSMLSAVNALQLMASRVLFAMSRDGLLSARVAATVNAGGTPTLALLLSTAVALLFVIFGRTFAGVIAVLAFFFVANYTLSFVSVFVLRRREPDAPRPYRAWGYPWTTLAALVGSLAFLAGAAVSDSDTGRNALLLLAASYPGYRLLKWSRGG